MCLQYLHNSVADRTESSDSGVDANSVSSCELSNLQQESPRDLFNKQQCVDYLQNGNWKSYFIYQFIYFFNFYIFLYIVIIDHLLSFIVIYCCHFLVSIWKCPPLTSLLWLSSYSFKKRCSVSHFVIYRTPLIQPLH